EVGEIAGAPVRAAANGVEVRDHPEARLVAEEVVRNDTAMRHDDERLLIVPLMTAGREREAHPVVSQRQVGGEREVDRSVAAPRAFGDVTLALLGIDFESPRAGMRAPRRRADRNMAQ